MNLLRIAARMAGVSITAAGLPKEALDAWHNKILKPLVEAQKVGRGMLYLTDQNMNPEAGQKAARAVQDFVNIWEPQINKMKTEMGAVAKEVSAAVVQSRGASTREI